MTETETAPPRAAPEPPRLPAEEAAAPAKDSYGRRLWRYLREVTAARRRAGHGSMTAQAACLMRAAARLLGEGGTGDALARRLLWPELAALLPDRAHARALVAAYDAKFPGLYGHVAARTAVIDAAVGAAVDDAGGARQVVLLGAGVDSRAYRLAAGRGAAWIEVDTPASQADKRRSLAALADVPADHVAFLPVDFETDSLEAALRACPAFDPALRTCFVWEFVAPYLSAAAVHGVLRTLNRLSAPGSVAVFDFVDQAIYDATGSAGLHGDREFLDGVRMLGEDSRWGLRPEDHAAWVDARGYRVLDHHDPARLEAEALGGCGVRSYGFYHVLVCEKVGEGRFDECEEEAEAEAPAAAVAAPAAAPTYAAAEAAVLAAVRELADEDEVDDAEIGPATSFIDLGLESVDVSAMKAKLEAALGRPVTEAAIFEHAGVAALARHLAPP